MQKSLNHAHVSIIIMEGININLVKVTVCKRKVENVCEKVKKTKTLITKTKYNVKRALSINELFLP